MLLTLLTRLRQIGIFFAENSVVSMTLLSQNKTKSDKSKSLKTLHCCGHCQVKLSGGVVIAESKLSVVIDASTVGAACVTITHAIGRTNELFTAVLDITEKLSTFFSFLAST